MGLGDFVNNAILNNNYQKRKQIYTYIKYMIELGLGHALIAFLKEMLILFSKEASFKLIRYQLNL